MPRKFKKPPVDRSEPIRDDAPPPSDEELLRRIEAAKKTRQHHKGSYAALGRPRS